MTPHVHVTLIPALSDNYIHIVHNTKSGHVAVVDPAEGQDVLKALEPLGYRLDAIWNTHHHGDHIGGNKLLKEKTGCKIYASKYDAHRIADVDVVLDEGDSFLFGDVSVNVFATPGHTLGHICFFLPQTKQLFAGDTLFAMGCGRLFEGDAKQMWNSLEKIKALPQDTMVYCAHEYTEANGQFALVTEPNNQHVIDRMQKVRMMRSKGLPTLPTSLSAELATNPFLRSDQDSLKDQLKLKDCADWQVFAEIRKRKDEFRV